MEKITQYIRIRTHIQYIHAQMDVRVNTYTQNNKKQKHTGIYTRTHAYTHTCTHAYMDTRIPDILRQWRVPQFIKGLRRFLRKS